MLIDNLNSFPAVLDGSLTTAINLSKAMIQNLVSRAQHSLHDQIVKSQDLVLRNSAQDALRLFEQTRVVWFDRFPKAVEQALRNHASGSAQTAAQEPKHAPTRLSFDALELMDDFQVQVRVQSARMQQSTLLVCERELADLDGLVCALLGLASVSPQRNPFRPQTFIEALNQVIEQTPAEASTRTLWSTHLGAGLGQELQLIYRHLNTDLKAKGIVAASYRVTPVATAPKQARAASPTPAAKQASWTAGSPVTPDDMRVTLEQLRSILAAKAPTGNQQMLMKSPEMNEIGELLHDLDEMKELVRLLAVNTPSPDAHAQPQLHDAGVASEVVRMLLGNLQVHPGLLKPVRDWVHSLQEPLQTLAATDVVFLRDAAHPVRQLLDKVIHRSLGFTTDSSEAFKEFFNPVLTVSHKLHRSDEISAQAFFVALQEVQRSWSHADELRQKAKEQAVQALLQAEQRNKLAENIGLELTRRKDAERAPIFIKQFLAGPWSQVLARAQLHPVEPAHTDDFKKLVDDLLWSTDDDLAPQNKKRLARIVPRVLLNLKSGLKTIDFPSARTDEFLVQLMKRHGQLLKALPSSAAERAPAEKLSRKELDELLDQPMQNLWIAPSEARDSGFMESAFEDVTATQPAPLTAPGNGVAKPASPLPTADITTPDLTLGAWVDVQKDHGWQRAQLTWISPRGSLFMFTAVDGAPFSMTLRTLKSLQAEDKVRPVSSSDLVSIALDAVVEAALQNTINLGD
jgi:Protein of unknown function (DUF1631)